MNVKERYLQFKEDGFSFEHKEATFVELTANHINGKTFFKCHQCQLQEEETSRVTIPLEKALEHVCDCAWVPTRFYSNIHDVVTQWFNQRQAFFNPVPETFVELYDLAENLDNIKEFNSYKTTRQWAEQRTQIMQNRVSQLKQKVQTIPLSEIVSFYHKLNLGNLKDETKLAVRAFSDKATGGTELVEEFEKKFFKAATEDTERKIREQTENPQFFLVNFNAACTIERMLFPNIPNTNLTVVPQAALEFVEHPYQNDSKYLVKLPKALTAAEQEILTGIYNPDSDGPYNDLRHCYQALKTLT